MRTRLFHPKRGGKEKRTLNIPEFLLKNLYHPIEPFSITQDQVFFIILTLVTPLKRNTIWHDWSRYYNLNYYNGGYIIPRELNHH